MLSWASTEHLLINYGPFIAVAVAMFLFLDTAFKTLLRRRQDTTAINTRLRVIEQTGDRQAALIALRRDRGLTAEGGYILPVIAINRLLLQSGRRLRFHYLLLTIVVVSVLVAVVCQVLSAPLPIALLLPPAAGLGLPLMFLIVSRSKRLHKLEEQLPEAVDVMVRSLRAGHPVPVAVGMVAREMPDPVGSEFGMVSDEMTYGLDLSTAMGNLRERTGQLDVAMLVVAISIQAKSGGNLAELLSNLARMIRDRSRMRRKIHALSAEGRISAIALSIVPLALFLIVSATAPTYYGDVKNDPMFMPSVYFGITLWVIGIVAIRRMVNFKI